MRFLLVFFCLTGVCFGVVSSPVPTASVLSSTSVFPFVLNRPVVYARTLYGFADKGFYKMGVEGQPAWCISKESNQVDFVDVKFDNLFFIERNGGVSAYHSGLGYKLWQLRLKDIKQWISAFPTCVAVHNSGALTGVDFETGKQLWQTNASYNWVFYVPEKQQLAGYRSKQWDWIDLLSGEVNSVDVPDLSGYRPQFAVGETVILKSTVNGALYELGFSPPTLTKVEWGKAMVLGENGGLIWGIDTQAKKVVGWDVDHWALTESMPVSGNATLSATFYYRDWFLVLDKGEGYLYRLPTGYQGKFKIESGQMLLHFEKEGPKLFLFYPDRYEQREIKL